MPEYDVFQSVSPTTSIPVTGAHNGAIRNIVDKEELLLAQALGLDLL